MTRITDEQVEAAIAAHDAECIRGAFDDTWKSGELIRSSMRAALEAALSTQPKAVNVEALTGLCEEWENLKVPRSANSYELGEFDGYQGARRDLTAIIGEGDWGG